MTAARAHAHGLLVGKFYPPHAGHHAAIRRAAAECERLTVLVMAAVAESVPLEDRVAWLRHEHPEVVVLGVRCDAPLDASDERVWSAQVAIMQAALRTSGGPPVDAVCCGDDYGDELAHRFDAKWLHLPRVPGGPSATAVRADLAGRWDELAPATRAGLATRVIVVGAESTGTTTVSRALAAHYLGRGAAWATTQWVPEYGREYTELLWAAQRARAPALPLAAVAWTTADFDRVAAGQTRREEAAAQVGSPVLVCDTDAFATSVWERRYLGAAARRDQGWTRPPLLPRRDVYLLTDHAGVPWHDDGMREGDLAVRAAMTGWFADALTAAGHSWVLLTGSLEQRVGLAVRTVDQVLAVRLRLAAPLHGPGFGEPA